MTDDFTNLETGASCYVLSNATTIYAYKSSYRTTYYQVGGKWYEAASSSYSSVPSSSVCWSYDDITSLNSNAEYYPIFAFMATILAIFVWYFVFRLISRLIRWRI